jgi:hypothetical protein
MSDPTAFHPDLTQDRLRIMAQVIVEARRGALELHDPEAGETNISLGTRTRERACQAFRLLASECDWLDHHTQGNYFLLLLGDSRLPIKFHRTDPDDPAPRTMRILEAESMAAQTAFAFLPPDQQVVADDSDHGWRLYFQDDKETREIFSVTLARVRPGGVDERWPIQIAEPVVTEAIAAGDLPEPADLDLPPVAPLPTAIPNQADGD